MNNFEFVMKQGGLEVAAEGKEKKLTALIDLTYLKTISNGSREFEHDMITSCSSEIDAKMQNLRDAVLNQDGKTITLQAHSLKTLCSIIGLVPLYELFRTMEVKHNERGYNQQSDGQYLEAEALWRQAKTELAILMDA